MNTDRLHHRYTEAEEKAEAARLALLKRLVEVVAPIGQAEAARIVGIDRQRMHQIINDYRRTDGHRLAEIIRAIENASQDGKKT